MTHRGGRRPDYESRRTAWERDESRRSVFVPPSADKQCRSRSGAIRGNGGEMWTHIAIFVIGVMCGGIAGILFTAMCAVAHDADEERRDGERAARLQRISGN